MLYGLFCVYDRVACIYNAPYIEVNKGAATRRFKALLKNDGVDPSELDLVQVGTFNSADGVVTPSNPELICNGGALSE